MKVRGPTRGAVLIGFMGSGKSSVGRELAGRLGTEFVDVDDRIEAEAGKSIREIFAAEGEKGFRDRERRAIRGAVSVPGRVIATGGGAFQDARNRKLLKAYAPVVFLDVSPATVLERLAGDASRPLLQGKDPGKAVTELMARRRPSYLEADHRVIAENLPPERVADKVHKLLGRAPGSPRPGESAERERRRR